MDISEETQKWAEPLRLADGSTAPCRTRSGPKGIPQALVEKKPGQENIDLAPMYWLIERWCQVQWSEQVTLTTPKGRVLTLDGWNELLYLIEKQFDKVLEDLPASSVPGRSGKPAGMKVASTCIVLRPLACAARTRVVDTKPPPETLDSLSLRPRVSGDSEACVQVGGRQQIWKALQHIHDDIETNSMEKRDKKCAAMPDVYYFL